MEHLDHVRMRSSWFGTFLAMFVWVSIDCFLCPCYLFAHSFKPVSFQTIVNKSGTIVHGIVLKVETGKDPATGLICTWTTLRILEQLKGDGDSRTLTFKQLGGVDRENGISWFSDTPVLIPGQEMLLCLYPKSVLGFTSPIGISQGVFFVKRDAEKNSTVIDNGMPKSVLFPDRADSSLQSTRIKTTSRNTASHSLVDQCQRLILDEVKQAISNYVNKDRKSISAMDVTWRRSIENKRQAKISQQ